MVAVLLLATRNKHKIEEIRRMLPLSAEIELVSVENSPSLGEPEEDGDTFSANAWKKASFYALHSGFPALADDSGLCVDALDGRPGVFSARYGNSDDNRIARLLQELHQIPANDRTAHFECAMSMASPEGHEIASSTGLIEGTIAFEKSGSHGFGYDPVFSINERGQTLADLQPEVKNRVSHRARALKLILPQILNYFAVKAVPE
jgi:XTP/dITP diphosphohydrolase